MFLEQNSANVCRQVPHGEVNSFSWYATTATASNSRTPCPMAVQMAALSAHTLGPNVPFSTLHPVIISPLFVLSAAPTEKLLYGQYALFRTLMAASTSSCTLASVARRFRGKRVGKSESISITKGETKVSGPSPYQGMKTPPPILRRPFR